MKKRGKLGVLFGIFFAFFGVITAIRIAGASGNTFKLKSSEITEKSPQTEAEIINYNDTEVSTRVEYHALNEFVTYKLGLSNSDTKSYKIVKITAESENPYLAYEYNEDFEATVAEGESFDFVLKTIYKTTVESITNRDQNADVVITILYEDESGNEEEEEVIVVPNTNDDTVVPNTGSTEKDGSKAVPIFPFLILLIGIIIAIVLYLKKHKKAAGVTLAITLALSIIAPLTAISVIDDTITIKNQLGFYNKLNITYPTGSGTANKIINYGEPGGDIPAPGNTPEGYEFDGFEDGDGNDYDPTKPVTSDIDLTPKYKAINYTISYSGLTTEETEFLKNPTSYTIHSSFTLKNPVDRKDSDDDLVQTFVGWSNGEATASAVTIEHQTGNKAYEAIWQDVEPTEYTITYDLDGGTADNRTKFTKYTDTFTLNNPTKTGYIFEGWTGSNGSAPETVVSVAKGTRENLEFTANFNPIHYTITFHGTSGTGDMAQITVAYDETVNLPVNTFDYPGHNFVRWNTKADGSGNTYDQAAEIHNLTTEDGYNLDLYAMWGSITYGITYYLNGGTANNTTTYVPEDSDITLNNPVKTGYTFTGWSGTGLTGENNLTVVIPSGSYGFREYTAHYSANQYTVRFNKNASTATGTMDDLEMSYDETKNLPMNQFTRPGYTFTNWSTATESYNDGDSIKNLTTEDGAIITLNANWEAGTYTIHYDSNGASGGQVADQTVTFDTPSMLAFNGFTKEGHTFVDWVCGGVHYAGGANFTNLATDKDQTITCVAQWNANTYDINYNNVTSSEVSAAGMPTSYTYSNDEFSFAGGPADRPGYYFNGWTGEGITDPQDSIYIAANATGEKTFTANWEPNTYYIVLHSNDGNDQTESQPMTYGVPASINPNSFIRDGYSFTGWNTNPNGSGTPYSSGANVNNLTTENQGEFDLYAQWTTVDYQINYELNGGTAIGNPTSYNAESDSIHLNNPTREGYNFTGWEGSELTGEDNMSVDVEFEPYTNKMFIAHWAPIHFTFIFDGNGGEGSMDNSTFAYDEISGEDVLPANGFTRNGWSFTGWNTQANGQGTAYNPGDSVHNFTTTDNLETTLYAQWGSIPYNILYNLDGGTANNPTVYSPETNTFTLNNPTKTGYLFTGWSGTGLEGENNLTVTITKGSYGIREYTAHYSPISYTLHFELGNSPDEIGDQVVYYDSAISNNYDPSYTGFTFIGFARTADGAVEIAPGDDIINLTTVNGAIINLYAKYDAHEYTVNYADSMCYKSALTQVVDTDNNMYISNLIPGDPQSEVWGTAFNVKNVELRTPSGEYDYATTATYAPAEFIAGAATFKYWADSADCSGGYSAHTAGSQAINLLHQPVDNEITLYAMWDLTEFTVRIHKNAPTNSNITGPETIDLDTKYTVIDDIQLPAQDGYGYNSPGYTLAGVTNVPDYNPSYFGTTYLDIQAIMTTQNCDLDTNICHFYAIWKPVKYHINYHKNGGEGAESGQSNILYGATIQLSDGSGYTREGYDLVGWSLNDGANNTKNYDLGQSVSNLTTNDGWTVNLYAVWEATPQQITYNLDGGTANNPSTYTIEDTITLNNPTKEGYQFTGWSGTGLEGEDNMTVTIPQGSMGAREYTAHYAELKTYTAYFEDLLYDVTNMPETQTGTSIEDSYEFTNLSIPSRGDRYEFLMWVDKVELEAQHVTHGYMGTTVVVTKPETTFQPIWMDKNLIIYEKNANDAVGTMQDQVYTKCNSTGTEACGTVTLNAPNYSRSGYGFAGWNTEPDGSGTSYGPNEDFPLTKDNKGHIYLYAMWVQSAGNMQSFNCNSLNAGDVTALTDTRDGQTYTVAKLTDGQCWMTENLRLDLSQDGDKLTTNNTNNPTAEFLTKSVQKPASANSSDWCEDDEETEACYNKITYGTENLSATGEDKKRYSYGVLYNGYTATAGNFKYDAAVGEAAGDICPNGWKMPTGGNSGETHAFVNALAGNSAFAYPNNMVLSGMEDGLFIGNESDLWTSTITNDVVVYHGMFYFSITKGYTDDNSIISPNHGHSVRCIAKPTKTYTLTYVVDNEAQNTPATQTGVTGADSYTFTITNDSPTWDLYWLDGWSTTEGGDVEYRSGDQITVTSDTTLYAVKYEKNLIIYNKNNNGATGTMENQSYTGMGWANYTTLRASNYSLSGYGFVGWNTEANGTGTTYGPNEYIPDVPASGHWNLYAMWIPSTGNLQNFNCNTLASGQVKALTDTRDGQTYAVAKLADGNCWMIENLRFNFATHGDQITTTNTNNPTAEFITKAAQKPSTKETWCDANQDCIDYNTSNITNQGEDNKYSYGVYYNYYAASAGNGGYAVESGNVEGDICPAGWRLPKGKNSGDLANLATNVLGVTAANDRAIRAYPNNIVYSGQVYNNAVGWLGRQSEFWTSSVRFPAAAYDATFGYEDQATYFNGSFAKDDGATVRCMTNN